MRQYDELVERLDECRAHCGMCGEQAVVRNSRDQYICEACLYEVIPTPPYRMRWEAADAIRDLEARLTEARKDAFEKAAKVAENWDGFAIGAAYWPGHIAAAIRALAEKE